MSAYNFERRSQWGPETWSHFPVKQQPIYDDCLDELEKVTTTLKRMPGLVHPNEVKRLRQLLAEVHEGKRFLLQGGDCAERFLDCHGPTIQTKMKMILQMSLILSYGSKMPIVRIGRMAGQYGKPRSSPVETLPDGTKIPSFKGDNVNGFDPKDREIKASRLMEGYFHSAATLNYIRSLLSSNFADLREAKHWKLDYVNSEEQRARFDEIVTKIMCALDFMETCGVGKQDELSTVDFFTSHEGLILAFESAMTRMYEGKYYGLSAHFLWIGDRTRQLDHAHVEYFRGIENPLGIKVGPSSDPNEIAEVVKVVNPTNEIGKVVLITRFGHDRVDELLPKVIDTIQKAGLNVIWQCDPMHGNTHKNPDGIKTRSFHKVLTELVSTFKIHQAHGSRLGGVHLEMTGEDVTECTGGPQDLTDEDLKFRYTSYCDPRLNYAQSMAVAFRLSELLSKESENKNSIKVNRLSSLSLRNLFP